MGWLIGRAAAMADPEAARKKALERLKGIAEMDDPEGLVVPILLDAARADHRREIQAVGGRIDGRKRGRASLPAP